MRRFPRLPMAVLAVALLAVTAAGCKPGDKTGNAGDAADKSAAKTDAAAASADKIPGLPTEKDQVSYMVGMALGKQLEPMKDDVDVDTIAKAMKNSLAGDKMLLTEEQAQKIGADFGQKLQKQQMEKMQADAKKSEEAGKEFLTNNGKQPGVETTQSGLQYQVLSAGDGAKPKASDTVKVVYKGSLLDGTVFDDSSKHGGPSEIPLSQVVPGWQEGIKLMPIGSKYKFWIPASLGYGESGAGPIPPNSTLVFEVELLEIVKPAAK